VAGFLADRVGTKAAMEAVAPLTADSRLVVAFEMRETRRNA